MTAVRVPLSRVLRVLPRRAHAIAHHALFQAEFSTLRRPRSYSQLLAARNLAPQDPLTARTADKLAVRSHVADRIGAEHLIPLLQVVDHADDLQLDKLDRPYVVKASHGCDMTVLVPYPAAADHARIRANAAQWLATDFYRQGWLEIAYRDLPRHVLVEAHIGAPDTATGPARVPIDYKFHVFAGTPAMITVNEDRFGDHTSSLMRPDWIPYTAGDGLPSPPAPPARPANLERMLEIAAVLGADFDYARIDLYDCGDRVWFGEITHNPGAGLIRLRPRPFDRALGRLWRTGEPIPERFTGLTGASDAASRQGRSLSVTPTLSRTDSNKWDESL